VSFSCPHFKPDNFCVRLNTDCVPGRRGCVLPASTVFAVPAEERVRLLETEKREQRRRALDEQSRMLSGGA
jgi:hypothetical protein